MQISSGGLRGGAEALSEVFGEGRDACQKALTDLRNLGLIETRTQRYHNGAYRSSTELTEAGWEFLETRISKTLKTRSLYSGDLVNSRLSTNSILSKKQTEYTEQVRDEEIYQKVELTAGGQMSDFPQAYDPDDIDRARSRAYQDKHEAKQEQIIKKHQKMKKRSMDPTAWSPTDSSFEFADRMFNLWHVEPWSVTKSRFRFALDDARATYGTNGTLECLMMDRYFSQIAHQTSLTNPEIIWKRFIQQFEALAIEARRATVTPQQLEQELIDAEKSWEGL